MKLTILYFARLKTQAATDSEVIETELDRVDDVYRFLQRERGLELSFNEIRAARNEHFCDGSTLLKDGDVVAFMPPMSGG